MGRFQRFRFGVIAVLPLAVAVGCSHQSDANNSTAQSDESGIPFHQDSQSQANDPQNPAADSSLPDQNQNQSGSGVPFRTLSGDLPAGTLLTVRLDNALSAAKLDTSEVFAAVIDEPIIVDGKILIARGTSVLGRIESARASEVKRNTGYVRLTLDSIKIQGKEFHLKTSSLFARGFVREAQKLATRENQPALNPTSQAKINQPNVPQPDVQHPGTNEFKTVSPAIIDLQKGRRLTFRLTETLSLAG